MSDVYFNDCSLFSTGMPQLNIREVFAAAQAETVLPAPELTVLPDPVLPARLRIGSRLGHSEWANIGFVTIALAGGLFSAFYFFNGADLLRAAGRWSREFLYPPPRSTPVNNVAPATKDAVAAATSASSTPQNGSNSSSGPFGRDYWSGNLATPASFASANGIGANGSVGGTGGSVVGSALDQLSTLRRGADNLFQTLYQTVPVASHVNSATGPVRKTIAGAGNLVLQRTPVTVRSNSNITSTSQGVQQTANAAQSGRSALGFNPGLGTQGLAGQLGIGGGRGAAGGGGVGGGSAGGVLGGLGLGGRGGR
jgi:hypothetical protein